jgi:hypothetical protein
MKKDLAYKKMPSMWNSRKRNPDDINSDGKFPEIFTGGNFPQDVRASFFTSLFFP